MPKNDAHVALAVGAEPHVAVATSNPTSVAIAIGTNAGTKRTVTPGVPATAGVGTGQTPATVHSAAAKGGSMRK
ncbi:hypothetical protein [Mycolicibacterium sp.]|uniref:hypothetical protein n=1 Tax=Mycolicibacterium sp. TaxID=2320850 RepID=UPI0037C8C53E